MSLDNVKLRRLEAKLGPRLYRKNASNQSSGTFDENGASDQSGGALEEGEQKHHTPKFIQHCVTAITEKPEKMAKIKKQKDGSPFAICHAQYKKNKRGLAAAHSRGKHHTVVQYERALKKLKEETERVRASKRSRENITFGSNGDDPRRTDRSQVLFQPE